MVETRRRPHADTAKPYRVAIVGSRHTPDRQAVVDYVTHLAKTAPETVIVSGGAQGVDNLAEGVARSWGMATLVFKPDNEPGATYGQKCAARNRKIVAACDRLVAFWDGKSPGSRMSIEFARAANKPVQVICPLGEGEADLRLDMLAQMDSDDEAVTAPDAPAAKPLIYLTGYGNRGITPFFEAVKGVNGRVVDIRYHAFSARSEWTREALLARFRPARYEHLPALGNTAHTLGRTITIADLPGGLAHVTHRAMEAGPLVLLCACGKPDACHRSVVGDALEARGFETRELIWN